MASEDSLKRIYMEYNKLQEWALVTKPKSFTIENAGFASLNNNGISRIFYIITGLIYPSIEPFTHWALRIEICIPDTFPQNGPEVYMKTNIRHPNIDTNGRICCAFLDESDSWEFCSLSDVVFQVTQLIEHAKPYPPYLVDAEMGTLYQTNYTEYNQKMKEMLINHGVPRPEEFIDINRAQQFVEILARAQHFVCQFDGCHKRCDGNHGPAITLCPIVHRERSQCEKCGQVCHPDDRPADFRCKQCNHVYCFSCSFQYRS